LPDFTRRKGPSAEKGRKGKETAKGGLKKSDRGLGKRDERKREIINPPLVFLYKRKERGQVGEGLVKSGARKDRELKGDLSGKKANKRSRQCIRRSRNRKKRRRQKDSPPTEIVGGGEKKW